MKCNRDETRQWRWAIGQWSGAAPVAATVTSRPTVSKAKQDKYQRHPNYSIENVSLEMNLHSRSGREQWENTRVPLRQVWNRPLCRPVSNLFHLFLSALVWFIVMLSSGVEVKESRAYIVHALFWIFFSFFVNSCMFQYTSLPLSLLFHRMIILLSS